MIEKKINIDDFTLNYYESEIESSDFVILLHGNGMSSLHLSQIYKKLQNTKKILAIDIRGCGKSTKGKKEIHIDLVAKDIIKFLENKNIKKADFIGYSDGANIAMLIEKINPNIINKMILICGNYTLNGICAWFRLLLNIFKLVLSIAAKFSSIAKDRLEILNLIFDDMKITDEDLKKFTSEALVLYAGIDVIHKKHSQKIASLIPNSKLILIKKATHENIVRNKLAISKIKDFLN